MENRLVTVTIVAVFLGVVIHVVSAQNSDVPVPCEVNSANCSDPRLPENAFCQSGFCVCTESDGEPRNCTLRNVQGKTAVTSHPCKLDQDCALDKGRCNTLRSQCECLPDHIMADKIRKCLPIAKSLGDKCEEDQQCRLSTMGNNTDCRNGQCSCSPGYHYSAEKCWKTAEFSESCVNDEECSHVENAECNENLQCACSSNAILNSNGQRCLLKAMKLLDSCVERQQCPKNLTDVDCIDERCQCRENYHYAPSASQCVATRKLGESCANDHECFQNVEEDDMGQPQRCINQICTCGEKFRKDGDKCVCLVSGSSSSLVSGLIMIVMPVILLFSRS